MVVYHKSLGKIMLIIIAVVIMLTLVYPAIKGAFLLAYMGRAQQNYWNKVDEVCSKNYMWIDDDEKFTLSLTSRREGGVLENQENGNCVQFAFNPMGIDFVDEDDNSLAWASWHYNEEKQIFVLEIDWFEDKGVFLKESMQLEEGTSISFYGKEIVNKS